MDCIAKYPDFLPQATMSLNPDAPSPEFTLADEAIVEIIACEWEEDHGYGPSPIGMFIKPNTDSKGQWGMVKRNFSLKEVTRRLEELRKKPYPDALYLRIRVIKGVWICSPEDITNYVEGIIRRRNHQIETLRRKLKEKPTTPNKKPAEA